MIKLAKEEESSPFCHSSFPLPPSPSPPHSTLQHRHNRHNRHTATQDNKIRQLTRHNENIKRQYWRIDGASKPLIPPTDLKYIQAIFQTCERSDESINLLPISNWNHYVGLLPSINPALPSTGPREGRQSKMAGSLAPQSPNRVAKFKIS